MNFDVQIYKSESPVDGSPEFRIDIPDAELHKATITEHFTDMVRTCLYTYWKREAYKITLDSKRFGVLLATYKGRNDTVMQAQLVAARINRYLDKYGQNNTLKV